MDSHCDYLIIGAGPAGLQLGYFLHKAGRDYKIVEAADAAGAFFAKYPRHDQLLSINKCYTGYDDTEINLRWDWNSLLSDSEEMLFKHYSSDYFPKRQELLAYLGDFANHFDLNVQYDTRVRQVAKRSGKFLLTDQRGEQLSCLRLIVATGVSQPYIPSIPGIELTEQYADMSTAPEDYAGQRVLVIGKGNSAFETANHLLSTTSLIHMSSPEPITMAWRSHFVGHLRSVNNTFLDSYLLKSQNVLLDAHILKIEQRGDEFVVKFHYTHAADEVEDLVYDRILSCTGFRLDTSIFDESCKPSLVIKDRFPEIDSEWESVSVENLYFAGTLMQSRDFKKKQSGFIHGFRYNVELMHRLMEKKYHEQPIACDRVPFDSSALAERVLERANRNSSLWQQTGYFCDLLIIEDQTALYYEDLTIDCAHEIFGDAERYYILTLEFGQERIDSMPDPFAVERIHKEDKDQAELSTGIHPIIECFSRRKSINMHHVIEDLASVWEEEVHTDPLDAYFSAELQSAQRDVA